MPVYEGQFDARDLRIALVASRFNELITKQLVDGACDGLRRHGADPDSVSVIWVPGAFEIPLVAQRLARSGGFDAIICLGAVIRGATAHFEHVAGQAAAGVARAALETGVPVLFGVLTTDTIEQALERAGTKSGNKGFDAALAAIEMATLLRHLPAALNTPSPEGSLITPSPEDRGRGTGGGG